jgi:hypothetical protein
MFYYNLNGQQQGPVAEEELRRMVSTGALAPDALVWREGMADWQPMAAVVSGISSTLQCSVCKQMFPPDQTLSISGKVVCATCKPKFVQGLREGVTDADNTLYYIALHQRRVIMCFAALLVCYLSQGVARAVNPIIAVPLSLMTLTALIFAVISVYRLARSLGYMAILYAIGMIIPCINLLVLLVVVSRATTALRKGGVKVGLFGVSKKTLQQLRAA